MEKGLYLLQRLHIRILIEFLTLMKIYFLVIEGKSPLVRFG